MNETDQTLLTRAVAGDADALSVLLRRHGPAAQARLAIAPQWRSMLEPEDVMQVTYLEAFMQIDRFDPARGTPFEAWLSHIAQNNLRDAVRGLSRLKQPQPKDRVHASPGLDSYTGLLDAIGVTTTTPSRVAAAAEAESAIESALAALPDDYAAVIRLYDLEGRAIGDVAAAVKRSPGAVHMLRARAHDRLRERLGGESRFFSAHP